MIAEPWDVGDGRLAGRQLPRRVVGVERRLPRPHAQLLAARHRARRAPTASRARASARSPAASPARTTSSRSSAARSPASTSSPRTTASPPPTWSRTTRSTTWATASTTATARTTTSRSTTASRARPRMPRCSRSRRRAIRNLLGTLLLSAGIPMLTAGDEFGRTPARQQQRLLPRRRADLAAVGARAVAATSCSRWCGS